MSRSRSRPSLAQECCALLGLEHDAFRRAFSHLEHELLAGDPNAAESKGDEGQTHDELAWALLVLIRAHGDALGGEDLLELTGQDSRRALILARDALRLLHTSCSGFHWPTRRQAPATLVRLALELGYASTLFLSSNDEAKSETKEGTLTGRKGAHACIDGRTPIKQCSTLFAQHLRVLHGACAREGFLENAHALLVSWWKEELAYDEPTRKVQDSLDDFFQLARACQASASTFEQATSRARALAPLMGQAVPYSRFLLQSTKASRSPRRLREALWAANLFSSSESATLAPQAMRFAVKYEHAEVLDLALRLIANAKPPIKDTLFTSSLEIVSRQDAALRRLALQKLRSSSRGMNSPVCSQSALFARVVAALESTSTDDGIDEVQLEIEI